MDGKQKRQRVLVVTTGGTITMHPEVDGGFGPGSNRSELLELVPQLLRAADIEVLELANIDSANMQPAFWGELARTLYERYTEFDGFVVLHGTDTMAYTACAVSFLLQELGKPIVFTGAQIPLGELGSDAQTNLINAVRVAASQLAEVCIVFGSQIIRGCRGRKVSAFDIEAFQSVNETPLGTIGLALRLGRDARRRSSRRRPLLSTELLANVAQVAVWPGMSPEIIRSLAATHAGLVLSGFGVGTLPSGPERSLLPAVEEAIRNGVPIVVATQCVVGSTAMERYRVGRSALDAGAIPAMDMTRECAHVKLMWALGQTRELRRIESIMLKDYVGEIQLSPD